MGKDMTYWLFIGMFQGLVAKTKAFRKDKDAIKAFREFTGFDWDRVNLDEEVWEELNNGEFTGSQVSELQIEA